MRNFPRWNSRIGRVAKSKRSCNQCGLILGRSTRFRLGFTDSEEALNGDVNGRRVGAGGHGWRSGEEFEPQWTIFGVRPVRPTFHHGIFDLASEHDDDVDVLFPNKTKGKNSQLIIH